MTGDPRQPVYMSDDMWNALSEADKNSFAGEAGESEVIGNVGANVPAGFKPWDLPALEQMYEWSPSKRWKVITQLVSNGFPVGDLDSNTMLSTKLEPALQSIMHFANERGISDLDQAIVAAGRNKEMVDAAFKQLTGKGGEGGGGGGPARPVFKAPDAATLRERVRGTLEQELGREPQAQELQELAAAFGKMARQQFDAAVGGGQQVDPNARFNELIRTKYATELDLLDQRQEAQVTTQIDQANMNFVDRLAAGGAM